MWVAKYNYVRSEEVIVRFIFSDFHVILNAFWFHAFPVLTYYNWACVLLRLLSKMCFVLVRN